MADITAATRCRKPRKQMAGKQKNGTVSGAIFLTGRCAASPHIRTAQAATAMRRRRIVAPVRPKPAMSIAHAAGSGTPGAETGGVDIVKPPEIAPFALFWVKLKVSDAGPATKDEKEPAGVKVPSAYAVKTRFDTGPTDNTSLSVPVKLPIALVKE